ncbi:MAG: hypothetical protein NC038_08025 [Paludibacter sp.]|nr:hypothetical protein [Bacteroidales bacterium]MCM1069907.1 hypothetical protein [Prevotella sp.]MCM1354588.1 hypothetical protein [Bacteroides sp.]MCM1443483.1 hypothetical protein [Muribaculum sp.]MCM1482566.1 hypothetical protein [Paludibacter sp.]
MAQGITINKNLFGGLKSVTIDWKRYGSDIMAFFQERGIDIDLKEKPNRQTQKAIDDAMKGKNVVEFDSVDELINTMYGL